MASICAVLFFLSGASSARAISQSLLDVIPPDHLCYVAADSSASDINANGHSKPTAQPLLISASASLLHQFGGQDAAQSTVAATLSVLRSLAMLEAFPHAIVITDASARELRPNSYRLSELQAVAIIQTDGDNATVTGHIQEMLTQWTSSDSARVTSKDEFDTRVYSLEDDRLPNWCVIRWAKVGAFYVVALGSQSFEDAAQSILGKKKRSPRESKLRHWRDLLESRSAHFECHLNLRGIRGALSPVIVGRPAAVLTTLGLGDCDRAMWSVRRANRAMLCNQLKIVGDEERFRPISIEAKGPYAQLISADVQEYTLFDLGLREMVLPVRDAYLASRRESVGRSLRTAWADFESQAGVSVQRDLLDQLGDCVLIHDDPPHPLDLPLLATIVIPIKGDSKSVRTGLDALLRQVNTWMTPSTSEPHVANPGLGPRFIKSDDGVWHFAFGLVGPAITVTDGYIVISHSPTACRLNRDRILPFERSGAN